MAVMAYKLPTEEEGSMNIVVENSLSYVQATNAEDDIPHVIDFGDGDVHFHTLESDYTYRDDSRKYHKAGKVKVTVIAAHQGHIYFERFLVVIWDRHFTGHPHFHDKCVNERARYYILDLALRWFYIGVLFFIIIILVALMIIAWLLCCSVCAIKKI
ncbi:hypothetical protein Pcinc_019392 [Petrolisthes cinctipes]|uniref:Uncharacterized protein n=1 Tax=Petrolisthes cinctipes TaxID=88211 RepID=A0AAE1KL89_PETCI|nr:hypothetical protein Pcinc_019392 [Petrolisthes cinctipes]